jgi:hypothetical protein
MPDALPTDAVHIPIVWGLFDPGLFEKNRQRLLRMGRANKLTPSQERTLGMLSDRNIITFSRYLHGFEKWREVSDNIAEALHIALRHDMSEGLDNESFIRLFRQELARAQGDVVLMGRQHSIMFPVHTVLREEMEDPDNTKVAEFVYDQHIDTVVNPGMEGVVTSGNVYFYLGATGLLEFPVIIGPDPGLIETYQKRGEHKKVPRIIIPQRIASINDAMRRKIVREILEGLKSRGVTNVTTAVDLDVLSSGEGSFAVRYSGLTPYLGLGCQELPDDLTLADIDTLKKLKYPTPQVRYLLQQDQAKSAQNISYARQFAGADVDGAPDFSPEMFQTDLGTGQGMRLDEVTKTIALVKQELPNYGIQDGITLKNGVRYRGAIVEFCGFENNERRTSRAAVACHHAIAA